MPKAETVVATTCTERYTNSAFSQTSVAIESRELGTRRPVSRSVFFCFTEQQRCCRESPTLIGLNDSRRPVVLSTPKPLSPLQRTRMYCVTTTRRPQPIGKVLDPAINASWHVYKQAVTVLATAFASGRFPSCRSAGAVAILPSAGARLLKRPFRPGRRNASRRQRRHLLD